MQQASMGVYAFIRKELKGNGKFSMAAIVITMSASAFDLKGRQKKHTKENKHEACL